MKIILKSTIYLLILMMLSCSAEKSAQWDPGKSKKKGMGIILTPNTSLRIDPIIFSSRISQMKKGEAVEVLNRSKEKKRIGRARNYWYKIKLASGITGWSFGAHIRILENSSKENIDSYLQKFWEKETKELSKDLHGKWWSVNQFGDFTSHSLEIYKDGKYKSYYKTSKRKIEGEYSFDFNNNSIIFSKGTSFKNGLEFFKRGAIYVLAKETDKKKIMFKKININPQSDEDKKNEKDKKMKKNKKPTEKGKNGSKTQ